MTCSLGEIGGLLFLAIFAGALLLAASACVFRALGARWFDDANRLEAIQQQYRRKDL